MHYLLINRTRPDLTADQYQQLAERAKAFYANVPAGIQLHSDWAAQDGSRTFAILEAETPEHLEQIQAPFREFVDIEVIPVTPIETFRS